MMRVLLKIVCILLGSHVVTSKQICPRELSTSCVCSSQSNQAFVSCSYPDPSNISKVLTVPTDQLQLSWIIQYFGIPNNSLTYLPDDYFDGFDVILVVDISGNQFASVPKALKKLPKTTELKLSSNQFVSVNIADFSVFQDLRKLDLSRNQINELVSTEPGVTMTVLRELNLSSNNVTYVEHKSLLSFPNLRNLIMSKNRNFEAISTLDFPEHISAMSLESTGIKRVDVCIFRNLNDLESLNLDDNDLQCTCDLFTLFSWIKVNRDDGLVHEVHGEESKWQCMENGMTVNISDFGNRKCNVTSILFSTSMCSERTPEESPNYNLLLSTVSEFKLNIESAESEHINLAWDAPNTTTLYGFVVVASLVSSEEDPFYTSRVLHPSTLSHSLQGSDVKSGNFRICVKVLLYNETTVAKEACDSVYIFSSQIIIGILAGVVFIVPFMAILFCIIRLDQRNIKKEQYMQIQEEKNIETKKDSVSVGTPAALCDQENATNKTNKTLISAGTVRPVPAGGTKTEYSPGASSGTDNPTFVNENKVEVKIKGASSDKSQIPIQHEPQYGAMSSHL